MDVTPLPKVTDLMRGRRGLIMGVANDHSIAWGIASALAQAGAELAFTYQGDTFARRVEPLAQSVAAAACLNCDVTDGASVDAVFAELEKIWGGLDFLVHAIAFSDKQELQGRYVDTSPDNFARTLDVSCYLVYRGGAPRRGVDEQGGRRIGGRDGDPHL